MPESILNTERALSSYILLGLGLVLLHFVCRCLYNLCLHPLYGFPGPKLAAMGGMNVRVLVRRDQGWHILVGNREDA